MQLEGKHILVTGASSGMGRVFAQMIAKEKAIVSLLARDRNRLEATLSSLTGMGHDFFICDLTDNEQIKKVVSDMSPYDGIVFCAGVNEYIPLKFIKQEKIDRIFQTNYFSDILLTHILL